MKSLTLSLLILGLVTGSALARSTAAREQGIAINAFAREPVIVYTSGRQTPAGVESTTLVVYQDGFATATRTEPGAPPRTLAGDVGPLKARSWYTALLRVGGDALDDGPTPDPVGAGAATLTLLEPLTDSLSHTFSFGPGDYPQVEATVRAILLRLNLL